MLRIMILAACFLGSPAFAKTKRSHKAHTHGATTLDMVVTSKTAAMDFRGPSESLFGFEHAPKSDKDKQTVKDQLAKLESKASDLVKFPADRECTTKIKETETFVEEGHDHDDDHDHKKGDHGHDDDHHHDGEHSEFHIKLETTCTKDIAGSDLAFGFSEIFPRVKSVKVQILTETGQFGKTVKGKTDKIKI